MPKFIVCADIIGIYLLLYIDNHKKLCYHKERNYQNGSFRKIGGVKMGKRKNYNTNSVPSSGREKNYDEKRVPSRLAEHYTHFGWVRARNRISEELDRKTQGIALMPKDDKQYTELIRRRKRFGYNSRLVWLEREYMKYLERYGKGALLVMFIGFILLIATVFCLIITFVPKYPTSVAEYNATSNVQNVFNDIGLKINGMLFYGDQYFVMDSDVNKDAEETGTVVTVPGSLTKAYKIDKNGQLVNVELGTLTEKLTLDEDGNVKILRVEKAYLDPEDDSSEYYKYYVLYDMATAPFSFAESVIKTLPAIIVSGTVLMAVAFLILTIVFFICTGCLFSVRKKHLKNSSLLSEAEKIVAAMKEEDPGLMSKSQRHFYSWQKLVSGAINMSNAAKNDNSGADGEFEIEFDF